MPITEAAVKSFIDQLSQARAITHRKMFGGVGLYCDGIFFAVIDNDRLYFKADEVTTPNYEPFGMPQWVIEGNNGGPMPYFQVPEEVLANLETVGQWIDDAVEVAKRKKKKK